MNQLITALLVGAGYGVVLSFLIGPVFFSLLQTSIHKGFKAGVLFATGIFLSDSLYIFLAYIGISQLLQDHDFTTVLGVTGGIFMIIFGLFSIFTPADRNKVLENGQDQKGFFRYIVKGFILNGMNPFVVFYWISMVGFSINQGFSNQEAIIFFSSIVCTVFTIDTIKCFLAQKISHLITYKLMLTINRIVGAGLFVFGCRLIFMTFRGGF